ncbi:MAG: 6-pyruvoyl trahydropterin synthase family protein [Deltaproteobacteria bacterium]
MNGGLWRTETTVSIDSCHWLDLKYPSPCSAEHGHRWVVTVKCEAGELNVEGMVVDFSRVKDIIRRWDHTAINLMAPFNMINPTAENLAEYWCRTINEAIHQEDNHPWCYEVDVEETPGSRAVYLSGRPQARLKRPAGAARRRVEV